MRFFRSTIENVVFQIFGLADGFTVIFICMLDFVRCDKSKSLNHCRPYDAKRLLTLCALENETMRITDNGTVSHSTSL